MTPGTAPSDFDARRHRGQLPAEVTGFVGRGRELSWLATMLDGARLITVAGPGGVGKTRVALRAAARAADEFPDGVRLVELSGLRDPALLPSAVASCLGLVEQDDRPQLAAVLDHLRTRRLLLILDTCEHLVDACALLAEAVLRQTAAVTVLATSRQPLDVPGEHTFRLQPLPVPAPEDEATAASGDAVELFAQRAIAAVPGFAVTAANRADVIRLCRRLDGIPLAIELAAVRLRALPLPELTDRLENRFHVLTGGRRGTVSRHQTLRTAIEWSYGLCTPAERALWDRLSVFAGDFDVAAAEDVGTCDMVPRDRVLQVLLSLVDKSVVLRDGPDGPDGARYRLLDSLREFAAERLAESGQEADCRARHIARYLAVARGFARNFAGDDQLARLRQLRAEHDNIRAALEYAFAGPGSDRDAAELACVLYAYWHISGSLREGAYWLDKVLDTFPGPSASPSPVRASALIDRALIGSVQGHPEAVARAREGTEIAALLGDERLSARGYLALNLTLTFAGYHDEAVEAGRQARRRLTAVGSRVGLSCLDAQMGLLYQLSGKFDQSVASCQHGLRGLAAGERWLRSYLHVISALALYQQPGKEAECAEALRQGLAAKHELGDYVGGAFALEALAWLAADTGRCERAGWLLGAAHPLWERAGTRLGNNAIMEEFHRRAVAKAGEALGAARLDALHAAGAAQSLDRIVALAIGDADSLTAGAGAGSRDREAGGLTKREQQIAALVASGLSNREIAEKLVISKRTVDAHVDHIFAKLGISSRVQLTVWLREQLPRARSGQLTRF